MSYHELLKSTFITKITVYLFRVFNIFVQLINCEAFTLKCCFHQFFYRVKNYLIKCLSKKT